LKDVDRVQETLDPKANIKGCFECHKPETQRDFVFTLTELLKARAEW
jgi:hypothetical protein